MDREREISDKIKRKYKRSMDTLFLIQLCPYLVDKNVVSISFGSCEFLGAGCAFIRLEGWADTQMWFERDL